MAGSTCKKRKNHVTLAMVTQKRNKSSENDDKANILLVNKLRSSYNEGSGN